MILRRSKVAKPVSSLPLVLPPATLSPAIEKAARVEAELADARRDLAAAQAEVNAAQQAYGAAADSARVSEAVAARNRTSEAETVMDIATRRVARLDADLQPLLAGAADAAAAHERELLRETAQRAQAAYAEAFRATMPTFTNQARALIRLWAQAELAREAAAVAGVQLPRADAFRDIAGTPRVEISRQEHDLWINPFGGSPYGNADQQEIRTDRDGTGVLQGANHVHRPTHKRRYADVTFQPAVPWQLAPALSEALVLPCITAGAPAGWSPLKAGTSPSAVLAALDALEAQQEAPRARQEVRTERQPIEPARDVRVNPDPAPYREYRGPYGSDGDEAIADAMAEGN